VRFPLEVRYNDYDTKGHINNAVYLTYFEMARARAWLEGVGGDAEFPFVVAEAQIRYRSEAMIGDPIDIEITTSEVRTKAWVWAYVIRNRSDERVIAEGSTVQVMFDYEARKSMAITPDIRERLGRV
jgi:acyl-CoA thioester hydrolase